MGQNSPFLPTSCSWVQFLLWSLWWIWSSPVCAHVSTVASLSLAVYRNLGSNDRLQLH